MTFVAFESLPPDARVWVFASDKPLDEPRSTTLLAAVDEFLGEWNAHGHALRCARSWRDGRFLAIGVDQSTAGASGCSIDGLFRTLQRVQPAIGANLLSAGCVYWRDADGAIAAGARGEFTKLASEGRVTGATRVFDTTVETAEAWRTRFERTAQESWHAALVKA